MTIEKLKRVMWRLRNMEGVDKTCTYKQLRRAIMLECGTHPRTYRYNRKALKDLGWLAFYNKSRLRLTDEDLLL